MRKIMLLLLVFCGMLLPGAAFAQILEFTVQKNDNFHMLAKKYAVKNVSLIELNRDRLKYRDNPNLIYPGQKFIVEIKSGGKIAGYQVDKSSDKIFKNNIVASDLMKASPVTDVKMSNMIVDRKPAEKKSSRMYAYALLAVVAIVMLLYVALFLSGNKNTQKPSFSRKRVGTKKNIAAVFLRLKNKIIVNTVIKKDVEAVLSLEKCLVGIDEDQRFHCFGEDIVSGVSGTCNEIARFIAKMYVRNVYITMIFIGEATNGCLSPLVPLTIENRNELERTIFEEIHLQKNRL